MEMFEMSGSDALRFKQNRSGFRLMDQRNNPENLEFRLMMLQWADDHFKFYRNTGVRCAGASV